MLNNNILLKFTLKNAKMLISNNNSINLNEINIFKKKTVIYYILFINKLIINNQTIKNNRIVNNNY